MNGLIEDHRRVKIRKMLDGAGVSCTRFTILARALGVVRFAEWAKEKGETKHPFPDIFNITDKLGDQWRNAFLLEAGCLLAAMQEIGLQIEEARNYLVSEWASLAFAGVKEPAVSLKAGILATDPVNPRPPPFKRAYVIADVEKFRQSIDFFRDKPLDLPQTH